MLCVQRKADREKIAYFVAAFTTGSKAFGSLTASSDRTLAVKRDACFVQAGDTTGRYGQKQKRWRRRKHPGLIVSGCASSGHETGKAGSSSIMTLRLSLHFLRLSGSFAPTNYAERFCWISWGWTVGSGQSAAYCLPLLRPSRQASPG